jgi:hypothetical protein
MNEAMGVAKTVSTAENPLTYFLVFVFALIALGIWRTGRAFTAVCMPLLTEAITKIAEIPEAIRLVGRDVSKELQSVKTEIDHKVEVSKDELMGKLGTYHAEVVREIRDEKLRVLANELRDSQTNEAKRVLEPGKKGRESRPG